MTTKQQEEILSYIKLINEKLWDGKEYGRAAIMIGAGFSRNAIKQLPATNCFPLWKDLYVLMHKDLYPQCNKMIDYDTPSVAMEYETAFGRTALDEFIIKNIPDKEYHSSNLHKLLLNLPWSDVFTTNYDTLLERTCEFIYDRKYDIVLRQEDIATAKKPRIVKLHGTIPSIKPFIITEEDYRTYPNKFAPFVNLVQESLMENIFCLIGFSAKDPNFIKWISWVKDNLGDAMPKIYLVDIFDISEYQKNVLKNKNIIPLDLSVFLDKNKYSSDSEYHYKAIEWFLWCIAKNRPIDPLFWPSKKKIKFCYDINPSKDLPEIPEFDETKNIPDKDLFKLDLKDKGEIKDELLKIKNEWEEERKRYPGWIVMPYDKIEKIWLETSYNNNIDKILDNIQQVGSPLNINILYELNWRLEKCMMPLVMDWIENYEKVIKLFNPFPKVINIESEFSPIKNPELNWKEISRQWIDLVFAIIRESREDLDEERFNKWIELIKDVVHHNQEWKARWHYEQIMLNFYKLNIEKTKELIIEWQEDFDYPQWELKRASILAEIGETEKAEEIAEKILNKARTLQQINKENIFLYSLEGLSMLLLNVLMQAQLKKDEETENNRLRWKELRQYECNPWDTFKTIKSMINTDELPIKPESERKKKFDPGEEIVSYYFGNTLDNILPAYQLLRIFEEGAIPFRCGFIEMGIKEITRASKWIESSAPLWALSSFIRTGEGKEDIIDKWFNRLLIASFSEEDVKKMQSILIPAWKQSFENIQKSKIRLDEINIYQRIFGTLTEIISRFLFRLDKDRINDIYITLINSYKNNNIMYLNNFLIKYRTYIKNLLKRLFFTLPDEDILNKVEELLSVPINEEMLKTLNNNLDFQDPMYFVEWFYIKSLPENFDRSSWNEPIDKLIKIMREGDIRARNIAIIRLIKLINIKALTEDEEKSFVEALWLRLDNNTGLPEANLYNFAYLKLPEPIRGEANAILKRWLLESPIPEKFGSHPNYSLENYLQSISFSCNPLLKTSKIDNNQFIEWSNKEIVIILEKFNHWIDKLKEHFKSYYLFEKEKNYLYRYSFYYLRILNLAIYPNINIKDSNNLNIIGNLVKESLNKLSEINIPIISALPGTLLFSKEKVSEIEGKLKKSLISSIPELVHSSINGIFYWLVYSQTMENFPKFNQELLNEIVNKVLTRGQPKLDYAIITVNSIIHNFSDTISVDNANHLCSALDFLLDETKFPEHKNLYYYPFEKPDLPEYRKVASSLALALKIWYKNKEYEVPNILKKWEDRSKNDRLPEIWKMWKNI